jgi:hypothetical protein
LARGLSGIYIRGHMGRFEAMDGNGVGAGSDLEVKGIRMLCRTL